METALHRELKSLYAADPDAQEVVVDGYRIDACAGGRLIEIQCAPLGAIRDKIRALLENGHRVRVVKPLAARTYIVRRESTEGPATSARYSPLRETIHHLFAELVHFTRVFPHRRIDLEVLLAEIEEHRVPARRRRWRRPDYRVVRRTLRCVHGRVLLRSRGDLLNLVPDGLDEPFGTDALASAAGIPRWLAQKMAYCLRETGAITAVDRRKTGWLYRRTQRRKRRRAA